MQMVAFSGSTQRLRFVFREAGEVELSLPEAKKEVTDRKLKLLNLSTAEDDCISFSTNQEESTMSERLTADRSSCCAL